MDQQLKDAWIENLTNGKNISGRTFVFHDHRQGVPHVVKWNYTYRDGDTETPRKGEERFESKTLAENMSRLMNQIYGEGSHWIEKA